MFVCGFLCLLRTVISVVDHQDTDSSACELLNDTFGYRAP